MTSTFLGNVKLNQHCMRGQSIIYNQGQTSVVPLHFVCGVFGLLFHLNSLFHWGEKEEDEFDIQKKPEFPNLCVVAPLHRLFSFGVYSPPLHCLIRKH